MTTVARKVALQGSLGQAWSGFIDGLERSLQLLDETLSEVEEVTEAIPGEWADDIEPIIDDLARYVYAISEPIGASAEDSRKIKELRRRLHDYYARFASIRRRQ